MCRYHNIGIGEAYKNRYACFSCRKAFKQYDRKHGTALSVCPQCKEQLVYVGKDFKPPRKEAKNTWTKLELITKVGRFQWNSCGCKGPGYIPKTLAEAKKKVGIKNRTTKKWNKH